jgi:GTPase SAR1 family protein
MAMFTKATRKRCKAKVALCGPSGSGKTMSALRLARGLTDGKIAVIDTENDSASLFSGVDPGNGTPLEFDALCLKAPYKAEAFIDALTAAKAEGYEAVVIDSFSHVWEGVLSYKAQLDASGGNSYVNWGNAGKKFQAVLDLVRQIDLHVICCMRSKMEYVLETNEKGKQTPRKVGLAPMVRDGTEYEFSVVFDIDMQHQARDSKGRLVHVFGEEPSLITEDTGAKLRDYLDSGEVVVVDEWTQERIKEATELTTKISKEKADEIRAMKIPPSKALEKLREAANVTA